MAQPTYEISAAALHAARTLLRHFDFQIGKNGKYAPTEKNIAIIVDVCTQVFRLEVAVKSITKQLPANLTVHELQSRSEQIREALRTVEMAYNYLPHFGEEQIYQSGSSEERQFLGNAGLR